MPKIQKLRQQFSKKQWRRAGTIMAVLLFAVMLWPLWLPSAFLALGISGCAPTKATPPPVGQESYLLFNKAQSVRSVEDFCKEEVESLQYRIANLRSRAIVEWQADGLLYIADQVTNLRKEMKVWEAFCRTPSTTKQLNKLRQSLRSLERMLNSWILVPVRNEIPDVPANLPARRAAGFLWIGYKKNCDCESRRARRVSFFMVFYRNKPSVSLYEKSQEDDKKSQGRGTLTEVSTLWFNRQL